MRTITVIGGGSWGTALAITLARSTTPHHVRLWALEKELVEQMVATRENHIFLPGFRLPREVQLTHDLAQAARGLGEVVGELDFSRQAEARQEDVVLARSHHLLDQLFFQRPQPHVVRSRATGQRDRQRRAPTAPADYCDGAHVNRPRVRISAAGRICFRCRPSALGCFRDVEAR